MRYRTWLIRSPYVLGLILVFPGCSRDYGNSFSPQANQCLEALKTKKQVPTLGVLTDEIRSVPFAHRATREHTHLYVSYTLSQGANTMWNMCVLAGGELAKDSEAIVVKEITDHIERCEQSTPCVKDCGMRWAKYASSTDARTLDWRQRRCTAANAQYSVREPSLLELQSRH